MTTSLPTTPSSEILPGAATALVGNAARGDGLAALFARVAPANGLAPDAAATGANTPEFTALLDGSTAPTTPGMGTGVGVTAVSIVPTAPANVPASPFTPVAPRAAGSEPLVAESMATATTDVRGLALVSTATTAPVTTAPTAPATIETSAPLGKTGQPNSKNTTASMPDRSTLEAVVALLLPVAMAVAPEAPALAAGVQNDTPAADSDTGVAIEGAETAVRPQVAVALPGRAPIALDETLLPVESHEDGEANFAAPNAPASLAENAPAAPVRAPAMPAPASAAPRETAVEQSAAASVPSAPATRLPERSPAQPAVAVGAPMPSRRSVEQSPAQPMLDAKPEASSTASVALEVSASAELPDGAVVTLALPKTPALAAARSSTAPTAAPVAMRRENSAAVALEKNLANSVSEAVSGKNFLSAEGEQVKPTRAEAGIGVAQTHPTMLFTPHDTLSAAHPTVPALVSMVSAAPQAAAAAPEPMPALVAASLAHRAVETITSVVDAQAASKLQPVPSVQLKFKFGAEDLAVRVALRDGVVTTEFRTDSPELRAAIQNEWKSVTAQPESALRFLEPIVSPASSSQSGTNSFAQQQHQQSPGQSAAQQQQQQQHQQTRAAADVFGSVARSTPFQPRDGGAASNIAPITLPTSVHLSAVA